MLKKWSDFLNFKPVMVNSTIVSFVLLSIALFYTFSGEQDLLTRYTKEDGFIEWLQFILFTCTSFLVALIAYIEITTKKSSALKKAFLLGFALLFMVGALEEISWFQRIADVQSSEFFLEHNKQGETNFHNMEVGEVSVNKDIITKLMFLFLLSHNIILPLVARRRKSLKKWIEDRGFYLPSLGGVFCYLIMIILAQTLVAHERKGEVLEVISGVHYFATVFAAYFMGDNYDSPLIKDSYAKKLANITYVFMLLFLIYISWILGNMSLKDYML